MAYNALMKTFLKSLWEKFMEKILLEPMVQKKLGGHFCSPLLFTFQRNMQMFAWWMINQVEKSHRPTLKEFQDRRI